MKHWGCVACLVLIGLVNVGRGENWPRFRGPNGSGVSADHGLPKSFTANDLSWNIKLPGMGHSSPVVWDDQVYVTVANEAGSERKLVCLDAATGTVRWTSLLAMTGVSLHAKNSYASDTPAADEQGVICTFADQQKTMITAYSHAGEQQWQRQLETFLAQHGPGVSPIIAEGLVILPRDIDGPSEIVAFDRQTGDTRWSVPRGFDRASYATPLIRTGASGTTEVVCLASSLGLTAHALATGEQTWSTEPLPARTVASPIEHLGLIIAQCGQGGGGTLLIAADPGKVQQGKAPIAFQTDKLLPYVVCPIGYGNDLYLWADRGVVTCVSGSTGVEIWTERIGGKFSGSPVCVDGTLYCISESGDVVTVGTGPKPVVYGSCPLGEFSYSTPAVSNGRIFFRTANRLMCLSAR